MNDMYYDKLKLEKFGYDIVDTDINENDLSKLKKAYQTVYEKAKSLEYKYFRVYDDYLGVVNISGIEMPFHPDIISKELVDVLNTTNIIKIAKAYLGDNIKMTLSRYHITGGKSHIGMWHRDGEIGNKSALLLSLFIYDEKGFELIEGSHNQETSIDRTVIGNKSNDHSKIEGTIHAEVKEGQMIVFNPAIIHRGISEKPRANIHFRFEVDDNYESLDLYHNEYGFNDDWMSVLSNKNTIIINESVPEFIVNKSLKNFLRKCIKTFVHYGIFFLPLNSSVYVKTGAYPSIKLRTLFNVS